MSAALDLRVLEDPEADKGGRHAAPDLLRFITCGSVDDGKSTLIGRLLYDAGAVPHDQIEAAARDSRRFGTQGDALDLALLVDGLAAEREQRITIDVAYRYFSTARRSFIVADTPGHEQYTRNMATGASTADLAVILIDARKGVLPQTRRHAFIVSLVGVKRVVVAINKMDLVAYDQGVFAAIGEDFKTATSALGFRDVTVIPVSALAGDNVARASDAMPWYRGPTLLAALEASTAPQASRPDAGFALPVQWVNRPGPDFRGFAGTIVTGRIAPGAPVTVLPAGTESEVARILGPSGDLDEAGAGDAVTITLRDDVDASRGDVIAGAKANIVVARAFSGRLLWMSDTPAAGRNLLVQQGHASGNAALEILGRIDIHSFAQHPAADLDANAIARVRIRSDRALALATYAADRTLGAFILIDKVSNETVALGVIDAVEAETSLRATGPRDRTVLRILAERFLLAPDADPATLPEAASWRLLSASVVGVGAALASGSILVGLGASLADGLLRGPLRTLHRALFRRRRAMGEAVSDGGGI